MKTGNGDDRGNIEWLRNIPTWAVILVTFGVGIAVIVIVVKGIPSGGSNRSRTAPPAQTSPSVGDTVTLSSGQKFVMVATTQDNHDELLTFARAGDETGIAKMILEGRVLPVQAGTKANLIEKTWALSRVRILDGPYATDDGWVPYEFAHK